MGEFDGRVAIVTGAAQGIGLATVRMLWEGGASVLAFDRDGDLLAESVAGLGAAIRVEAFAGDVTEKSSVEASVARAESRFGPVDIMVNNAGIWIIKSFLDYTDEEFDRTLTINLRGTWLFMKAVAPGMVARKHGVIVNLASVAAYTFTVPHAPYAASKAAVAALTRDVAFELAPYGVRVNAIAPGSINNPRRGKDKGPTKGQPLGSGTPDDIAGAIRFLCSDASRYVIGQTIRVAGGGDLSVSQGWGPIGVPADARA
jgi:3-oxoacyl-[acyl-carrier protein] reductase